MADKKITELTELTTLSDNDVFPVVEIATPETKKSKWSAVKSTLKSYFDTLYLSVSATTAAISDSNDRRYCTEAQKTVISNTSGTNSGNETVTTIGALINGATAKTAPADNDMIGLMDSGASNVVKKLSWAYVKSALKTYFDTLYGSPRYKNCSTAQQTGFSSETYLDGSCVTIPAGSIVAGSYYKCVFDISKTAAGTGSLIIKVWAGTTGTTSDTCLRSTIFAPGTAAADSGRAIVEILFRTGGSSATGRSLMTIFHDLAAAGLTTKGIASYSISAANLSSATKIGVSLKGGESFAGTVELVSAEFVP